MTLTYPAYIAVVTNLDIGWELSVTAGDTYDPGDLCWLADGLQLRWGFKNQVPSQLDPETATFSILSDGIANMPGFQIGHRVTIVLMRPTAGSPITYMEFTGRVTDTTLVLDAGDGRNLMTVTCVDPTSELTIPVTNGAALNPLNVGNIPIVIENTYELVNAIEDQVGPHWLTAPFLSWVGVASVGLPEFVDKSANAGLNDDDGYPVLRYALPNTISDPDWGGNFTNAGAVWEMFLAQWLHQLAGTLHPLFLYAFSATDADQVTVTPATSPTLDGAVTYLDACFIPDLAELTIDRTTAPNTITVTGVDQSTGDELVPGGAIDSGAREAFGAITRDIETRAYEDLDQLAERYLAISPSNAADAWQLPAATVLTQHMTDAELDALAPRFWTARYPTPGVMGTPVAVFNIDADVDPTDGFLMAHLAGCTFNISGGELTISPDLQPTNLPAGGTRSDPTYDDFGASSFGAATYHDQGGTTDYINPDITYEKARLSSL